MRYSLPKRAEPMHRVPIWKGAVLRTVLQTVLKQKGSHREAAQWLGIGQTTFTRLLHGTPKGKYLTSMRHDTFASIRDALDNNQFKFDLGLDEPLEEMGLLGDFYDSLLSWEGQRVREHYEDWLNRELERVSNKASQVLTELKGELVYGRLIRKFIEEIAMREELPEPSTGSEAKRLWIALYRSLEPLANGDATWGVERRWQELHATGELRRYLSSAFRREQILMSREHDFERISTCKMPSEGWEPWIPDDDE
jgi:hypothetical protein